jgi:LysM repeat protein
MRNLFFFAAFALLLTLLASSINAESLDQTNKVTDVNTLNVKDSDHVGGKPKPKLKSKLHPQPVKHHSKPTPQPTKHSGNKHHNNNNKHHNDNNKHQHGHHSNKHHNNNNNNQTNEPAPAPVRDGNYCQYTVQSGDSLSGIGDQLGVDWQTLASINGISDPNLIYAGQVLNYPCSGDGGGGGGGGGDSRDQLVACGQALYNNRYNEVYTQTASRWQGINDGIYPPSTPQYSDCSSAVSWCYWTVFGNGPDIINNANWAGGYTGTMGSNGWAIDCGDLQPGDVILYGDGAPWDHAEMYMGNGQTVSHGSDPVSYQNAWSLQGFNSNQCRRYFN